MGRLLQATAADGTLNETRSLGKPMDTLRTRLPARGLSETLPGAAVYVARRRTLEVRRALNSIPRLRPRNGGGS